MQTPDTLLFYTACPTMRTESIKLQGFTKGLSSHIHVQCGRAKPLLYTVILHSALNINEEGSQRGRQRTIKTRFYKIMNFFKFVIKLSMTYKIVAYLKAHKAMLLVALTAWRASRISV